ncbi:MAG: tetratricopeptide repeat protein [Planctomycetota bacterium]|nr:MAG: tetratricopeptide repeat protein [Planctomycetota bacterium]
MSDSSASFEGSLFDSRPVAAVRPSAPSGGGGLLRWGAPAALVLLVFVTFMPALDAGLVDWDDDDLLLYETRYQAINADTLRWMFTTSYAGHFQPLTWLSYAMDWALWKRETAGYHLTNVVLHIVTVVLFYFVTLRLLTWRRGERAPPDRPARIGAFVAAALYALHPLRVESVVWLAERRDVLSGALYLGSVLCYLRYAAGRGAEASGKRRRLAYAGAVALCALSLLAKATAVTLPVVLLILDRYPLRRWRGRPSRTVWLEKVPFFLLAIPAGVRAIIAQQDAGAIATLAQHGVLARLGQTVYGLVFYLHKTLVPSQLGPLYEIPPNDVLLGTSLGVRAGVLAGILVLVWALRRRIPAVVTAFGIYLVLLLPVIGIVQSGPQLVADRYSYLATMGWFVMAGAGVRRLMQTARWRGSANVRAGTVLGLALVMTGSARATFRQCDAWLSPFTLWTHAVRVSPQSAIAHTNLGDVYLRIDDFPDAFEQYQAALQLNPYDAVALHRLGDIYARFDQPYEAIRHYLHSLSIDPNRRRACFSLARLLVRVGRPRDAVRVLEDGIRRHPEAVELLEYLASLRATHADPAVRDAEEALRLMRYVLKRVDVRREPRTLLTLAAGYAELGDFDKAVETARAGLLLARRQGYVPLVKEFERRLRFFERGQPFYVGASEPSPSTGSATP